MFRTPVGGIARAFLWAIVLTLGAAAPAVRAGEQAQPAKKHRPNPNGPVQKGPITIPATKANALTFTALGNYVKVQGPVYWEDFFSTRNLHFDVVITNVSSVKAYYQYNLAFYDSAGNLVCCGQQDQVFALDPGKNDTLKGLTIAIPKANVFRIASYQFVLIDSTVNIGDQ